MHNQPKNGKYQSYSLWFDPTGAQTHDRQHSRCACLLLEHRYGLERTNNEHYMQNSTDRTCDGQVQTRHLSETRWQQNDKKNYVFLFSLFFYISFITFSSIDFFQLSSYFIFSCKDGF